MRVLAELPHPDCKITLFGMNQKFIIKFEKGLLEQTFKISEMDIVDGINGVFQLIDDAFMKNVLETFDRMLHGFKEAYDRHEY